MNWHRIAPKNEVKLRNGQSKRPFNMQFHKPLPLAIYM